MKFFSRLPAAHLRPVDLTRLASGDLPEREARRLRRHLSTCAHCQAEWQAMQTVWQAARDEQFRIIAAPPADLRGRVFAALSSPPTGPERKPAMLAFFARPVVGASLAAATVFVGVGALTYGPALVFHAPRAVAFEDVEAAMGGIKTATWTETRMQTSTKNKMHWVSEGKGTAVWARLDPPALVYKSTVYGHRPEGHRFLTTERGTLSYTPGKNEYFLFDGLAIRQEGAARLRRRIVETILFPQNARLQNAMQTPGGPEDAPFKWRSTPWKSETVTLDGKPALRFSRHSIRFRDDSSWWKKQVKQEYNLTLFADPKTFRIVRRDWEQTKGMGGPSRTVSDHFGYNETPTPDTFIVVPPPVGQSVLLTDWTESGLRSKLPNAPKKEATSLIQRLAETRNKNDWQAFSALWDYSYAPSLFALLQEKSSDTPKKTAVALRDPRRSEAAYRAQEEQNFKKGILYQPKGILSETGTRYKTWHLKAFNGIGHPFFTAYTRKNEADPFPPLTPPQVYSARAIVMAVTPEGRQETQIVEWTLVQTNAGLRVADMRFDGPP